MILAMFINILKHHTGYSVHSNEVWICRHRFFFLLYDNINSHYTKADKRVGVIGVIWESTEWEYKWCSLACMCFGSLFNPMVRLTKNEIFVVVKKWLLDKCVTFRNFGLTFVDDVWYIIALSYIWSDNSPPKSEAKV